MERCSRSLFMKEMQINTTVRYHFTPVRIAIINKSTNNTAGEDVEKGNPFALLVGDRSSHCVKQYGVKILKMELPYDPAIPLLGIYPEKSETLI